MSDDEIIKQQIIAELSSIDFQINDLVLRVTETAKSLEQIDYEASSHELFEVERSLLAASRRLRRATSELKL